MQKEKIKQILISEYFPWKIWGVVQLFIFGSLLSEICVYFTVKPDDQKALSLMILIITLSFSLFFGSQLGPIFFRKKFFEKYSAKISDAKVADYAAKEIDRLEKQKIENIKYLTKVILKEREDNERDMMRINKEITELRVFL